MKIFIAIPTIGQQCTAGLANFLYNVGLQNGRPVGFKVRISDGSSPIAFPVEYQRNLLVKQFLESDCDWLWFIDSDVLPTSNSMQLFKLFKDADLVAGIYPIMNVGKEPPVVWSFYETNSTFDAFAPMDIGDRGGVIEAGAAGTGCMLISRRLLEDKRMRLDETSDPPAIFHTPRAANGQVGGTEDLNFCGRALKLGYKLLVDTDVRWGHVKTHDISDNLAVGKWAFVQGYQYCARSNDIELAVPKVA